MSLWHASKRATHPLPGDHGGIVESVHKGALQKAIKAEFNAGGSECSTYPFFGCEILGEFEGLTERFA